MAVPNSDQSPSALSTLRIDPDAEIMGPSISPVSAKQESDFFERGGAEFKLAHNRLNLGTLGKFFGANAEASTNIAGFVIVVALAILVGTLYMVPTAEVADVRKSLGTLITSALAFIFGAASKK